MLRTPAGGRLIRLHRVQPGVAEDDGEAFRFSDLESEVLDVEGTPFRTATARMLYRMKKDTVRPQDRLDAQLLKERFGLEED